MPRRPRPGPLRDRGRSLSRPSSQPEPHPDHDNQQELEHLLTNLYTSIPPRRVYAPRKSYSAVFPRPHLIQSGQTTSDIMARESLENMTGPYSIKFPSPSAKHAECTSIYSRSPLCRRRPAFDVPCTAPEQERTRRSEQCCNGIDRQRNGLPGGARALAHVADLGHEPQFNWPAAVERNWTAVASRAPLQRAGVSTRTSRRHAFDAAGGDDYTHTAPRTKQVDSRKSYAEFVLVFGDGGGIAYTPSLAVARKCLARTNADAINVHGA